MTTRLRTSERYDGDVNRVSDAMDMLAEISATPQQHTTRFYIQPPRLQTASLVSHLMSASSGTS